MKTQRYSSHFTLTSALGGDGWSTQRPGRFSQREEARYPFYKMLVGAPGPVWTGAENFSSTGIRLPDRRVRNDFLYRLCYPGLFCMRFVESDHVHVKEHYTVNAVENIYGL
jgi:hypothetical protein